MSSELQDEDILTDAHCSGQADHKVGCVAFNLSQQEKFVNAVLPSKLLSG
jgi:hypothetical protein